MAKHRKHNRQQGGDNTNNFDMSQMGNLLNMNPNQLSGLLNNVDLNQLSSMFQGMSSNSGGSENTGGNVQQPSGDKRMDILNAIRPLVDAEKSQLIDSIIQIYNISRIIKR
jgi:hypothetical protein